MVEEAVVDRGYVSVSDDDYESDVELSQWQREIRRRGAKAADKGTEDLQTSEFGKEFWEDKVDGMEEIV